MVGAFAGGTCLAKALLVQRVVDVGDHLQHVTLGLRLVPS